MPNKCVTNFYSCKLLCCYHTIIAVIYLVGSLSTSYPVMEPVTSMTLLPGKSLLAIGHMYVVYILS